MRRFTLLAAAFVALSALPASAGANGDDGGSSNGPSAKVKSVATIVTFEGSTSRTAFDFIVYNCPAGAPITITWEHQQPRTGDGGGGTVTGLVSTGDPEQRFVLTSLASDRPGYDWVGTGVVTCGAVPIPVAGSGEMRSVNDIGGSDDDGGDDD